MMMKPKSGGAFRAVVTDDPYDFDMSYTGSSATNPYVIKNAYSTVLKMKLGPDVGFTDVIAEPALAEKWEVSPDATTYTFKLRKGVKFANSAPVNGREVTAADVKFSYEYMARVNEYKDLTRGQFRWMFPGLESVTTPDASTVVVKFKNSFAPFLTYAASSDNVIMPREIFDAEGHFKDTAVGSGPFLLDQNASQRGSKWVMKKNPTYYEDGKPYLDEYHIVVVRDEATRQAAFASKQIDYYIGTTDAKTWDEVRRLAPGTNEFIFTSTPRSLYLQLNDSIFSDPKLREAVACALDRDELIKVGGGGRGEWALMFANTRSDLFTQEEIKAILCHDLEKAKRLVKESGYTEGVAIPMLYNPEAAEATTAPTELIQAQLKKAGINIQFDVVSGADFTKRRRARQIDIMFLGEAQRADVDASLHLAIHPDGSFNYTNVDDPKINKLLVDQRQEVDPVKRRELLREILRYANGNNIIHGMYRANQNIFTHTYVHDFYHHADLRTQGSMINAWIDK